MSANTLRWLARAGLLAAAATLAGCELWPYEAGYPYTTTDPISDFGQATHDLYAKVTYVVLVIFALVTALLAYTLIRFRDDGQPGNPEQIHGNTQMEVGWTLLPIFIVLTLIIPTVRTIFQIADAPPLGARDADGQLLVDADGKPLKPTVEIKAIGKRWWWAFEYVNDGIMGAGDPDPGLVILTGNQIAIPDDRPVSVLIESDTVIHSFWVPRIGGKRDAVPGRTNRIWFNLTEDVAPGEPMHIRGECAEYCGEAHALMRFEVLALDGADYEQWVREMKEPRPLAADIKDKGEAAFTEGGCVACHMVTGNKGASAGRIGPNLTAFGDRRWIAAGVHDMYPNGRSDTTRARELLKQWIRHPNSLKPGTALLDNGTPRFDGMVIPKAGADGILSEDEFPEDKLDAIVDYLLAMQTSFPLQ